ncbi:hypothetical protein BOX15_Mlig000723g14 [Macrostomum lignano]|uniref:Uncharacterized protein n=1 Tax=Macrostomum lignano TaxID=282301 RepID=A0A267DDE7_9PLAT|nr:hypothetical protein BOX15_Mlig000723g14 [Macrostomum lignano]
MYDCHESVRQTLTDDELINRKAASIIEAGFHSSQVFLFEYGPDLELMDHPRHVLPVAAVQFKFDGLIRDQCFKRKTQPTLDRKQPKQQQQETQAQQVQQQMQQDQKDEAETLEHAPKPEQKQQENAKCSAASAEAVSSSAESSTESSPIRSRSQRRPRPVCPDRQDWVKKFNDGAYLVGEVLLPLLPAGPSLKLGLVSLEKTPSVLPFLQLGSLPSATPCRVVDSADLEARLANCGVSLTEEKPVCRLADSSAGYVSYLAGLFDPSNAARARTLCEMLITKDCLLLAPMTESADGAGALCYLVPSQSALSKRLQLDSATLLGRTKNLIHVLIWLPIPRRQLLCQGSTDPGAQWAPVCRSTVRCYNLQDCFSGLADRMKQAAEAIGKQRIEAAAKAAQEQAKQLESRDPRVRLAAARSGAKPVSAAPVSAPRGSAAPVSAPPVSTPLVSAAPESASSVFATPVSLLRDSATPVPPDPQVSAVSAVPVLDPQESAVPVLDPQVSAVPVLDPQVSAAPVPDPQVSAGPVPDPQVSAAPVPDPQVSDSLIAASTETPVPVTSKSVHQYLPLRINLGNRCLQSFLVSAAIIAAVGLLLATGRAAVRTGIAAATEAATIAETTATIEEAVVVVGSVAAAAIAVAAVIVKSAAP